MTACSALLSALTLSLAPINRAIDAVTPDPRPIVNPRTKKNRGILKATAAIALPLIRPINIISTIVYNVWIPIPAMMGIASFQSPFSGFSRKSSRRENFCSIVAMPISLIHRSKWPHDGNKVSSHDP